MKRPAASESSKATTSPKDANRKRTRPTRSKQAINDTARAAAGGLAPEAAAAAAGAQPVSIAGTTADSADEIPRCKWVGMYRGSSAAEYVRYHDEEWGRPVHDDCKLFELLVLEGAQAGLSWSTILAKRDAYRAAFQGFDPAKVAAFDEARVQALLAEGSGVVRHRGKLASAVQNARVVLELQRQHGSFNQFVWSFVPNSQPIVNGWDSMVQVPSKTPEAEALSKALKQAGMSFVGPTTCYAFMQAAGLVNDHTCDCHCHQPIVDSYSSQPLLQQQSHQVAAAAAAAGSRHQEVSRQKAGKRRPFSQGNGPA